MLHRARNNTQTLFTEIYDLPLKESRGPIESLFLDMESYLKRKDVSIADSVSSFFDQLFPVVYHYNVNDPRRMELSEDYRDCLMEARQTLNPQPFGEVPNKLSHELAKALGSSRAFLEGLHLGIETINKTENVPLDPRCLHALTRMEYCSHCQGYVDIHPCKGFCFNVVRGCMAYIQDIDEHWNRFVQALYDLTKNMRGIYDIEEMFHPFHTHVSNAVLHAMETGVRFSDKVCSSVSHRHIMIL